MMRWLFLLLTLVFNAAASMSMGAESCGSIRGTVRDNANARGIPGAALTLTGAGQSVRANERGEYAIEKIHAGSFNMTVSANGYRTEVKTDVIVRPKRITYLNIEMDIQLPTINETVSVTGSYFHENKKTPLSTFNLSAEEVRRAPGSGGDINRVAATLTGVAGLTERLQLQKRVLLQMVQWKPIRIQRIPNQYPAASGD
jgi:hypothetical protein